MQLDICMNPPSQSTELQPRSLPFFVIACRRIGKGAIDSADSIHHAPHLSVIPGLLRVGAFQQSRGVNIPVKSPQANSCREAFVHIPGVIIPVKSPQANGSSVKIIRPFRFSAFRQRAPAPHCLI